MTDINQKILDLILEGKTTIQIMETLNLSHKQLKIRLDSIKNSGYTLSYNVSDTGKVRYDVLKNIALALTNTLTIHLEKDPFTFTALVDSDFHTGHPKDNFHRINELYEYAAKEDINIIINCGDIIDGCCEGQEEAIIKKQVEKLIETKIEILSPIIRGEKGTHKEVLDDLRRDGFSRVRIDGEVLNLSEDITLEKNIKNNLKN